MIADEVFNSLVWETVDGAGIGELVRGRTVCGAEPIDYPLTSGAVLYLTDRAGNMTAVELGLRRDASAVEEDFYIRAASVPREERGA